MRPTSLGERIARLSGCVRDRAAVIASDGQSTYGELSETKNGARWPRVALRAENALGLVKGLVSLDGSVDALAVIPSSLVKADLEDALSRYGLKLLDYNEGAVFDGKKSDLRPRNEWKSPGIARDTL